MTQQLNVSAGMDRSVSRQSPITVRLASKGVIYVSPISCVLEPHLPRRSLPLLDIALPNAPRRILFRIA